MDWQTYLQTWEARMTFNRARTLGFLDQVLTQPQPAQALGYRPGPGRAHIAWQLAHIGITEGLFATERLFPDQPVLFAELVPRFKGGSTPDDDIPSGELLKDVLAQSREKLFAAVRQFTAADLDQVKVSLKDGRKLTLQQVLQILAWHEPHHQGQAHITLNLYKAAL